MRASILAALVAAEGIAGHVIERTPHPPAEDPACAATGKAVYFITNDATNSIVALPINEDGTLGEGTITPAGGDGTNSLAGEQKLPAVPDALVSQGALTVAGNYIFAVNAGSNTLTMLTISKEDPTKLAVVGKPAKVPADFPNTVAASTKNGLACVGASGAVAGITCAPFTKRGLGAFDKLRAIDLGQTTPPLGPLNTVSHSFFSEDEATLFTTVKGDPTVGKAGFLSSLQIEETASCRGAKRRAAAAQDLRSTPEGTNVLFGSQVIPGTGKVFATDASFGAAVLQVDRATGQAVVAGKTAIEGQAATCWAAFAPATGTVFVTDVAVPRIVEMSADDAGVVAQLDLSPDAPDAGFTDLLASGNFLYALAPGNGTMDAAIVVVDIAGGPGSAKFLQRFSLEGLGGANAQGIAILN